MINNNNYITLKKNALQLARNKYNWENTAKTLIEIYNKLI